MDQEPPWLVAGRVDPKCDELSIPTSAGEMKPYLQCCHKCLLVVIGTLAVPLPIDMSHPEVDRATKFAAAGSNGVHCTAPFPTHESPHTGRAIEHPVVL